ncbi:hypothetical protein L9F63_007290, partial [Diploptera punctata]
FLSEVSVPKTAAAAMIPDVDDDLIGMNESFSIFIIHVHFGLFGSTRKYTHVEHPKLSLIEQLACSEYRNCPYCFFITFLFHIQLRVSHFLQVSDQGNPKDRINFVNVSGSNFSSMQENSLCVRRSALQCNLLFCLVSKKNSIIYRNNHEYRMHESYE